MFPEASFLYLPGLISILQGLSGRKLEKLPEDALGLSSAPDPCPLDTALQALSRAVDEEMRMEKRLDGRE